MTTKSFNARHGITVGAGNIVVADANGNITANTIVVGGSSLNSTAYAGTANNATYLNGQLASYYTNASNLSTGTIDVLRLPTSGVTANVYGNSSSIPVVTVDTYGRVTSITTSAVASVTSFTYAAANSTFSLGTSGGSSYTATITAANSTVAGVVTVLDSTTNTSITIAASANTVKNAYDRAIDANTRAASAQTAAISAYSNAVSVASADATNKAANAYSNAVSYAATIAGTAYSNAVATAAGDATLKANNAYTTAVSTAASDATNKAANAYSNAVSYAATIAGTAYSNAVSTAAADATSKANNAYTTAVAAAASDATSKANNAYTTAVSAASTDATNKAANAYSNATTFASNASNISSGTLAEARLPFRMNQNVRTTDTVQFGNMTVTGNLTVSGTTVTVSANNLVLQDNMIYLNDGNTVANPDLGIAGNYNDGTYRHAGFFRDATDGVWKVYDQYLPEPDASPYIDTSNASFRVADFQANVVTMASANVGGATINSTAYTGTANNTAFVGSVAAANVVSNTQLSSNLANYALLSGATFTGKLRYQANTGFDAGNYLYFGYEEHFGGVDTGGLDYGYITYDNNSTKYGSGGGETSVLRIGTSNDGTGVVSDALALEPTAEIYLNPGSGGIKVGNYSSFWTITNGTGLVANATGLHVNSSYIATLSSNNATYLNGIDSSRVLYGSNASGSTLASGTQDVYELAQRKSGFWDANPGAAWTPDSAAYWWGATFAHVSNGPSYNYSGQLAFKNGLGGNQIYARTISNGTPSSWSHILSSGNYTSYAMPAGSSATNSVDVRAPIFYDNDNTSYYIDPFSLSNVYRINSDGMSGNQFLTGTTNYTDVINGSTWYGIGRANSDLLGGGGNTVQVAGYYGLRMRTSSATLDVYPTYTQASGSMRAPLFYDSEDTTYYINPNSTSNLVGLTVANAITGSVSGSATYVSRTVAANAFAVLAEATIGDNDFFRIGAGGASNAGYAEIATADDGTEPIYVRQYTGVFTTIARTATLLDGSGNTSFPGNISSGGNLSGGQLYLTGEINLTGAATKYIDANGSLLIRYSDDSTFFTNRLLVDSTGFVQSYGDFRAPIFYDSNDTNYYANPNGNSKFNNLFVGANESLIYEPATNAMGIRTGASGAYKYFTFTSGGRFVVNNEGIDCTGYFNIAYNNGNQFAGMAIRNNFASATNIGTNFIDFNNENGTQKTSMFGIIATDGAGYLQFLSTAPAVARTTDNRTTTAYAYYNQWSFQTAAGIASNVYYDRDNSAYYIDPNSTSNLLGLTVTNTITGSISGSSNVANFLNGGASSITKDDITTRTNSGFWQSSTGTTAEGWPINSTNWQHLISSTHSNNDNYYALQLSASFYDQGLFYRSTNGSGTTAWSRVALYNNAYADNLRATTFYDNDNTAYYVDATSASRLSSILVGGNESLIYENATNYMSVRVGASGSYKYFRFDTNGYLYTQDGGVIAEAGDIRAPIFYDQNNTGYYIDPTGSTSLRIAGDIRSDSGTWTGESAGKIQYHASNWYLQFANALLGRNSSGSDVFTVMSSGQVTASADFRSQLFYDNNDTNYYLNPNGTSVLYNMNLINLRCQFDRSWDNYPGIKVLNTTDQGPQADFRIHGGPGANGGDFGVRLLVDGDITSLVNVNAGNAMYAPIYYDSNNTSYYLSPDYFSNIHSIYVTQKFYAQGGTGVNECCGSDATVSIGGNSSRPPSISWHYSGVMQGNMQGNQTGWRKIYFYDDQGNGLGVHATGQIASNADVIAYYSDKRLKKDLARVVDHWNVINNLTGYRFTWNEKSGEIPGFQDKVGKREVGLIAQDVQAVYPEAIAMRTEGPEDDPYMTIKHDRFTAVFIEALKDLRRELDEVKEENKKLREMINGQ